MEESNIKSEPDKEKDLTIHVAGSVKGGCGKTAFSLFKTIELAAAARKNQLEESQKNNMHPFSKVIWIDADMRGTSSRDLFYSDNEEVFSKYKNILRIISKDQYKKVLGELPRYTLNKLYFEGNLNPYTLNDFLNNDINQIDRMIVKGVFIEEDENKERLERDIWINGFGDFIFASSDPKQKARYNYGVDAVSVEVGRYSERMEVLLKSLIEKRDSRTLLDIQNEKDRYDDWFGYNDIVIDMPPGDDAYASALMEAIIRIAEKNPKVKVAVYTLTTSDRGHISSMYGRLQQISERKYRNKRFISYAVLSEIHDQEFSEETRSSIINRIRSKKLADGVLYSVFQRNYYDFCRQDITIAGEFRSQIEEMQL